MAVTEVGLKWDARLLTAVALAEVVATVLVLLVADGADDPATVAAATEDGALL